MPLLVTVNFVDKELWQWPIDSPAPIQVLLPDGVTPTGRLASIVSHQGRSYILGAFSSPICFDEGGFATIMGLLAPSVAPTIAPDGAGNVDGEGIGYYAYRYKVGARVICESNLSPGNAAVTFTNDMCAWSDFAPSPDIKATHLVAYRSMEGGLPREAGERFVGVTGFTENRAELALGAAPPNDGADLNGRRGVPPWTMFGASFHERLWLAGDPRYPDRAWYSEVSEFEAFGGDNYIQTREGEPITGIAKHRDTLLIFCRRCCYIVRGYTRDDFTIYKLDPQIGCVSHFSIKDVNNVLWWAAEEGVYAYDGGRPKYVMEPLRNYWADEFAADPVPFQNSQAAWDPVEQVYTLLTPRITAGTDPEEPVSDVNPPVSPRSVYYECDASDPGQYHWMIRKRDRIDSALCVLSDGRLVTGSSDGYVRLENQWLDADDDGDTYLKKLKIRTGLYLFGDPGGSTEDGQTFGPCWVYVTAENTQDPTLPTVWICDFLAGDEEAWSQITPDNVRHFHRFTNPASALSQTADAGLESYTQVAIPKSVHHFVPEKVTGRGLCFYMEASSPVDVRFLGLGGIRQPGKATRKTLSETLLPNSAALDAVSFWKLEEASGSRADAYAVNALTDNNTVMQAAGKIGNAASFVRANSEYLSIADGVQTGLNPGTGDFSISAWIYPQELTENFYTVVCKGATGLAPYAVGYDVFLRGPGAGGPGIGVKFGDAVSVISGCQYNIVTPITLGVWYHILVTFDRDGTSILYLNGVAAGSGAMSEFGDSTGACNPGFAFTLGIDSTSGTNYFDGRIDAVGIWNRLLTEDEIAYLYYAGAGKELEPPA